MIFEGIRNALLIWIGLAVPVTWLMFQHPHVKDIMANHERDIDPEHRQPIRTIVMVATGCVWPVFLVSLAGYELRRMFGTKD